MNDDNAGSVDKLAHAAFLNIKARLASVSTGASLAWAELRVVASHAGLAIGLVLVAAGLALVGWGLFLLLGALLLINMGFSTVISLIGVIILNAIALVVVCLYIRHTLKIINFKHTRKALGVESPELSHPE